MINVFIGSDFVVGDLWGYKKFYDLSKLVR